MPIKSKIKPMPKLDPIEQEIVNEKVEKVEVDLGELKPKPGVMTPPPDAELPVQPKPVPVKE